MPRARGGRGRGRGAGRGRGRAVTSPVAVTPVSDGRPERRAAFEARKAGLMEKALELAEMEDAAAAVVCSGIDGLGGADYWPSVEAASAVAELFHELPEGIRSTGVHAHARYVEGLRDTQRSKLSELREGGIAAALGPWEHALDGMSEHALRELLASIEVSQKAARSRIRELQPQPDESVAENSVAGEEAATPASGEVQGKLKKLPRDDEDEDAAWMKQLYLTEKPEPAIGNAAPCDAGMIERVNVAGKEGTGVEVQGRQKQPRGADDGQGTQKQTPGDDDDDAAWMNQLVEDLTEKPEPASGSAAPYDAGMIDLKKLPRDDDGEDAAWMKQLYLTEKPAPANGNAAPCDAGMIERINVAGKEGRGVEVQGRQKQPQGADDEQGTQKQTPRDDDDDNAWMKQLVEDLKEKPEPASGSAAPYDAGMIEYINVGGYVLEQDTYDFIRFDLGMFPPSLEPESPNYDEPLRLWSWDDSSFPQSVPPPKYT